MWSAESRKMRNTLSTRCMGLILIIAAMNKFPEDAELQHDACGVLENLMQWDEFKDAVKQAGGRRALVEAIENHQDESEKYVKELQLWATSAIKKLF